MIEQGKISNAQFSILVLMFIIGSSALVVPAIVTLEARQDAWLSHVIGMALGVMLVKLYGSLAARYPGLTLVEFSKRILGKWGGAWVSLLFFLYVLLLTAGLLRIIGEFLNTYILVETPIQAIEIAFCITVIMGVRLGLEVFTRTSVMLLPYVILFFLLLFLLLLPQIKMSNFAPLMEDGISPVLRGSFRLLGTPYLNMVILLMIAPHMAEPRKMERQMVIGLLMGGFILLMITCLSIAVLGPEDTTRHYFPIFVLAQKIDIGRFIQRIEIITGGLIFIAIFVKISICFYAMIMSFTQIFQLNHYKYLTYPFGMLVIVLSILLFPNIVYMNVLFRDMATPFALLFGLLLPILLLLVDMWRKLFRKNQRKRAGSR